jgi:pimeloyl-ACP methyl ester carboxylesterase
MKTPSDPKYDFLKQSWENPGPDARRRIAQHVTLEGFRGEFVGELPNGVADRISPDLWTLHWSLMSTPERVANLIRLLEDQPSTLEWFPSEQSYLREHQPPTLIVWGPHDGYMPEKSARAYHRDLPDAPLHPLRGGHWLLETHLDGSSRWWRTSFCGASSNDDSLERHTLSESHLGESNPRPIHYE